MTAMARLASKRWLAGTVLAVTTLVLVALISFSVVEIVTIPPGPTAYHDHDFAPFAAISLGLPLLVAYVGNLLRIARNEAPTPLVVWVSALNLALVVLALGSTR